MPLQTHFGGVAFAWTVIPIFYLNQPLSDYKSGTGHDEKRYQLFHGSCRTLLLVDGITTNSFDEDQVQKANGILVSSLQSWDSMCIAAPFIPEFFLTDFLDDFIPPGLLVLSDKAADDLIISECERVCIILDYLDVTFCDNVAAVDKQILELLGREHLYKLNKPYDPKHASLTVLERRLRVGVHNGLTYVESPVCLYLQTSADDVFFVQKRSHSTGNDQFRSNDVAISSDVLPVENVLIARNNVRLTRLCRDPHFAIVFSLDYLIGTKISETRIADSRLVLLAWNVWCPFATGESTTSQTNTVTVSLVGGPRPNPNDSLCFKNLLSFKSALSDKLVLNGNVPRTQAQPQISLKFHFTVVDPKSLISTMPSSNSQTSALLFEKHASPKLSQRNTSGIQIKDHLASSESSTIASDAGSESIPSIALLQSVEKKTPKRANKIEEDDEALDTLIPVEEGKLGHAFTHEPAPDNFVLSDSTDSLISSFPRRVAAHLAQFDFPPIEGNNCRVKASLVDSQFTGPVGQKLAELVDPRLPNSEIVIQFMAIKFVRNNFYEPAATTERSPQVFFTLRFYRFRQIATERLVAYSNAKEQSAFDPLVLHRLNEDGRIWESSDSLGFLIRMRVDHRFLPATNPEDFVSHLSHNKMFIDVWASDSLIHLGTSVIPLKFLLRGHATAIQANIQCPVVQNGFHLSGKMIVALLYLRIANIGFPNDPQFVNEQHFGHNNRRLGVNKVQNEMMPLSQRARPLNGIHQNALQKFITFQKLDIQQRKENLFSGKDFARFQKWNELKRRGLLGSFPLQSSVKRFVFEEELEAYKMIRLETKARALLRAVFKGITTEHSISPKFGEVEFFEFLLQNPSTEQISCIVDVTDSRLQPVTNASEWKFFKEAYGIKGPVERDLFHADEKSGQFAVLLRPMESLFLPLKFDLFAQRSGVFDDPNMTAPFSIKAIFKRTDLGEPIAILDLLVTCRSFAVTESFRWFNEEKRKICRLIGIPSASGGKKRIISFRMTDPTVVCSLRNNSNGEQSLDFMCHTDESPTVKEFLILLYADRFCGCLVSVWHFSLHSLCKLNIEAVQGQSTQIPLHLKASPLDQLVALYSSSSSVSFSPHHSFVSSPQIFGELSAILSPNFSGRRLVVLTGVESASSQILGAWLVSVDVSEQFAKIFEVHFPGNLPATIQKKIAFKNQYGIESHFGFRSSDPTLLTVETKSCKLGARASTSIGLRFHRPKVFGDASSIMKQVLVFVQNASIGQQEEVYIVKIFYYS